jgi:stage V sporulation protein G
MENTTLDITELRIYPTKKESAIKAFCTATFNHALCVSGIRIKEGKKGVYVAFPLTTSATGKRHPVVFPATGEARREISNRILATYVINHCVDDYTL